MKLWIFFTLALLWLEVQNGSSSGPPSGPHPTLGPGQQTRLSPPVGGRASSTQSQLDVKSVNKTNNMLVKLKRGLVLEGVRTPAVKTHQTFVEKHISYPSQGCFASHSSPSLGVCQQPKRKKETGRKRPKGRYPKVKEKEPGSKGPSILTQVLDKGRFLRLGDTLSLNPGKTLELRCKGTKIGWAYPSYLDTYNDNRLSIKQHERFGQLILTSPSGADTGEYSCWVILCDGIDCERDSDTISTTYIYFTDKDELFVPSAIHFEIAYLRPDKPTTVPCRVTNPKIQVSLHREVPPEEIPVDGTQILYNPTRGFIIQNPGPEHKGAYYCKANSTTKTTSQISTKYLLLYVEVPSGPPFATIQASSNTVSGGEVFNLTCTVLGEPEMNVSFSWRFPGQGQRPVEIQDYWRLINRGVGHTTRISQSVLIVDDAETIDFGKYICTAKNKHGETSVATLVKSDY